MISLALALVWLAIIAVVVPWSRAAVIAWLVSGLFVSATTLIAHPGALRLGVVLLGVAWVLIMLFPRRSPLSALSRAEWACHDVVLGVSAGARAAYQAHTLAAQRATFVAELEALEPPNEVWRLVKTAQLLDMRADPPQVGVGDATERLVSWPWRVALDHRIVPLRLRLDDVIRARRLRRNPLPGFDDMTTVMRYDYYFLHPLVARLRDLEAREGGLAQWHEEAAVLLALGGEVRPPHASWTRLRDLILEIEGLVLRSASTELDAMERERLANVADEVRDTWTELEQHDARGMAAARTR